eukprot:m.108046 g.108046  ORF g.108046 m.108046 type:complete len:154 (+) comp37306_c1_seq10:2020-2481(+)
MFPSNFVTMQTVLSSRKPALQNQVSKAEAIPSRSKRYQELWRSGSGDSPGKTSRAVYDFSPKREQYRVLFEYTALKEDELILKVGDIVEVLHKNVTEGWWEGILNGRVGLFPSNFIDRNTETEEDDKVRNCCTFFLLIHAHWLTLKCILYYCT